MLPAGSDRAEPSFDPHKLQERLAEQCRLLIDLERSLDGAIDGRAKAAGDSGSRTTNDAR